MDEKEAALLAQQVMAYRGNAGKFNSAADLIAVDGMAAAIDFSGTRNSETASSFLDLLAYDTGSKKLHVMNSSLIPVSPVFPVV